MSVLITGGAGFIGRHLGNALLSRGEVVRVLDDGSTGDLGSLDPRIELISRDISNFSQEDWKKVLKPDDVVFHLAARKLNTPGVSDSDLITTNLTSTVSLAKAAASMGIRKIVFSSSLYVYGHRSRLETNEEMPPFPQTLYGLSKLAGEDALRLLLECSSVDWNIARLYFVYGPGQFPGSGYKSVIVRNFERIFQGLPPIVRGSGMQVLDYIFVSDVVDALILLCEKGKRGEVYNVSSGKPTSIIDLTRLMLETAQEPNLEEEYGEKDWTEGTHRSGSAQKLSIDLGWSPKISLEDGLFETWMEIKSRVTEL